MTNLTRRDFVRTATTAAAGLWLPFGLEQRSASWHARAVRMAIGNKAIEELQHRLGRNKVLLPGEPGYDAASAPKNGRYAEVRPVAVALCGSERDVVTCVKWSRDWNVQPVARGGAHSYAGFSTTRGLLIDLAALKTSRSTSAAGSASWAEPRSTPTSSPTSGREFLPPRRDLPGGRRRRPGARGRDRLQHALGRAHLRSPTCLPHRHRRWRRARDRRLTPSRPVLGLPRRGGRELRDKHVVHVPAA